MKHAVQAIAIAAFLCVTANAFAAPSFGGLSLVGHRPGTTSTFTLAFTTPHAKESSFSTRRSKYNLGVWTDATLGLNEAVAKSDIYTPMLVKLSATYFYKASDTTLFGTWKAATVNTGTAFSPKPGEELTIIGSIHTAKFTGNNLHIKPGVYTDIMKIVTRDVSATFDIVHYMTVKYIK